MSTSEVDWEESSSDDYAESTSHRKKRRKLVKQQHSSRTSLPQNASERRALDVPAVSSIFEDLLQTLTSVSGSAGDYDSFEPFIEPSLPELVEASAIAQVARLRSDENGQQIIPMTRLQSKTVIDQLNPDQSTEHALLKRRLTLHPGTLRSSILNSRDSPACVIDTPVTPLETPRPLPANPEVLKALYDIRTTPYENSFLSRLQGFQPSCQGPILAVDWESHTPWMDLMRDIRDHFALMHSEREQPVEVESPIEYSTLRACHLDQVHELLSRTFWDGIDVSDSLQYSPERCTVIATYKNLVVGVALLSSPLQTYITYLAVKPGWDNAQIATTMLYHLITLNPHKDITLHVSIDNPAVLLYNRFGFKAEEFIVGFYEDYLDPQSRASKNAFRLRLRQS